MLETRGLLLRLFTSPDAETVFCNWASDPEVARCLTWSAHENVSVRAGRPQLSGGVRRLLLRYAGEETEWIEKKAAALQLLFFGASGFGPDVYGQRTPGRERPE